MNYPLHERLAYEFREELARTVTPEQWREIQRRNGLPEYAGPICASHDFCDANEVMAAAFAKVMGRDALPDDDSGMTDSDCELWGAAWAIAKREHLSPGKW
ncbi:hypothetical protein [Novosphingobium sp.]|uniref:hypothetical protein n=1 Tax=Novosphingobium sp. TaxID=1874826 RepID=UPI00286D84B4|nr:hypothetical protein [Novosphingobium sp.]